MKSTLQKKMVNKKRPNFIIIGAMKCGTTSSAVTLNSHPEIGMLIKSEARFFDRIEEWEKGEEYYENKFSFIPDDIEVIGEKSPNYCFSKDAIQRIHQYDANMKLIMMVRNPVLRAFSNYNMNVQTGKTTLSFRDFNDKFANNISRGFYIEQIKYILSIFPEKNLHVCVSEEIKENPVASYNEIFNFLNVRNLSPSELDIDFTRNQRKHTVELADEEMERLQEVYTPYNHSLFDFLGKEIKSWTRNS